MDLLANESSPRWAAVSVGARLLDEAERSNSVPSPWLFTDRFAGAQGVIPSASQAAATAPFE